MKKSIIRMLIISVILVALLSVFASKVEATGTAVNPLNLQGTTVTPTPAQTVVTPTPTQTTIVATPTAVPTSTSSYGNSNLPKTGDAEDIALFLFIAACVVIAIFAYGKYRKYNV